MVMGYNGWSNYETWCLNLWFTNEEGSCRYWQELAESACMDNVDDGKVDRDAAAYHLARLIEENCNDAVENTGIEGYLADLLNSAVSEVDYDEVARHFIDDIADEVDEGLEVSLSEECE